MSFIRYRGIIFGISGALVLGSIIALAIPPALKAGIDFSGGTAITVEFDREVEASGVEAALNTIGHDDAVVQATSDNSFFIRVSELRPAVRNANGEIVEPGGLEDVEAVLSSLGSFETPRSDSVSGVIGAENIRNAIIAVIVASAAILLYITWAFRHVPKPIRYGTAAIIALVHDVLIVLGVFSLLGKTIDLEVNAMFITGVLTTIGYSVNDTIVVFDRIRENVARYSGATLNEIANLSIRETIGRSLNTSITLLVVVVALMLFASTSIRPLLFVLATGVIVGTYSSIFIATMTLVAWENGEIGRFMGRIPLIGARWRPIT
jgi:preprotein translocase subunit SecF